MSRETGRLRALEMPVYEAQTPTVEATAGYPRPQDG